MSIRATALVFSLLLAVGAAAAQSSSNPAPNGQPSTKERLRTSDCERMHWEAVQTYSRPAIPNREQHPDSRRIYIDSTSQPSLTLPKLRRQWLQPSTEASPDISTEILPPTDESYGTSFRSKAQKEKP